MKKQISWTYNIAFFLIIICMIPIMNFNNIFMDLIVCIAIITILIDAFMTLKNYRWYKEEDRFIKSLKEEINIFYDELHKYFAEDKSYPDNDLDINISGYKQILQHTDINEYDYEIFITKGAIECFPHPRYWITIFAPKDIAHEYPFIIDLNVLRNEADRNMEFIKVLSKYRPIILGKEDKGFDNYRPYNFYTIEDDGRMGSTIVADKRQVYFSYIPKSKLSITDDLIVKNRVSNKIQRRIEYKVVKRKDRLANEETKLYGEDN